jgi:hypothetical protein
MRKLFLAAVALISLCLTAFSQSITPSVLNSTGGTAKVNNKFYLDWSAGEMTMVNTIQNTGYSGLIIVTNGFLQPDKDDAEGDESVPDYVKNSLKPDVKAINLRVYPNPASNYIMIEFPEEETGKIRLTLYDAMGQMVYYKELTTYGHHTKERLSMAAFMQGTYLLRVQMGPPGLKSKEITYKIYKAN